MDRPTKQKRNTAEKTKETPRGGSLTATIPLMCFDEVVGHAVVDTEDHKRLAKFRWGMMKAGRTFYAKRQENIAGTPGGSRCIYMHREILGLPQGTGHAIEADHLNHDGLDNRRQNLRVVTRNEQNQNRRAFTKSKSGVPGVSFTKGRPGSRGAWIAQVMRDGAFLCRSSHPDMKSAIAARNEAVALYESKRQQVSA